MTALKAILVTLGLLLATSVEADIWISTKHHEGDIPLLRPKSGEYYDGNTLWDKCSSNQASKAYVACLAYISGVTDVFISQNANNICTPKNVTKGQLADVVTKYLQDHPETRHYLAESEILVALEIAFPCR